MATKAAAPPSPEQDDASDSMILSTLRAPPPHAVLVSDLTVVAPPQAWTLPLAVPITMPKSIQRAIMKRRGREEDVAKELIRRITLEVVPGQVMALIGGSGSGKTTLLNAIACRLGGLEIASGSLKFVPTRKQSSAPPADQKELGSLHQKGVNKIIGYVRQDDFLLPYLTVRETLTFSANLRLPSSVDARTKAAIVEQTILELGLKDAADVIVGGPFRKGISGGEKRRLSIGCILVTLPSVLVLDEPTTGLDSSTAYRLLQTLSNLAKRGRTVVLSIHQPRSDAFPLLDQVTLLSRGSLVYSGPTQDMLAYFREQGHAPDQHVNPLDFVVDVSSIDTRDEHREAESRERVGQLVAQWRTKEDAECHTRTPSTIDQFAEQADVEKGVQRVASRGSQMGEPEQTKRANALSQTLLLTARATTNLSRNVGQNVGFFTQASVIGIAMGLAFYFPPETPGGVQSIKTIVYQSTPAFFYLSIIVACFIYSGELVVFDREREDNLYGVVPYVVSLFVSNLPANVCMPTLYGVIVYFMTGFRRDNLAVNVLSFIAQCILQQLAACGYALLCVAINRSFAQASLLANGFSIVFILTSGYLIVNIPVWIAWTRWLSPYYYGFHWIARLQFTERTFACEGTTGPALNACDGNRVLVGLKFPMSTPLYVYPLGLLGFVVTTYALATFLLMVHHPGGVKYAPPPALKLKSAESTELGEKSEEEALLATPVQVDVTVDNLQLVVNKRTLKGGGSSKTILSGVNATFLAGQVSVIMGPSGAGKSSLLQVLAGRLSSGLRSDFKSSGRVLLNGNELGPSTSSWVAFVEQEDNWALPALTVRETLRYSARLSLRGQSVAQTEARVEEILRVLGLKTCANNLVGGELLKGISGGEKRRLSLGVQLLADPPVLLADEPLSGLDAFTARNVMALLQDLAASGRTVIVSVHQPRSDVWQMFDNVLLLARGGRSAYSGPRTQVLPFLAVAGQDCPENFNPADFLLDVISVDQRSEKQLAETEARVAHVLTEWSTHAAEYQTKPRDGGGFGETDGKNAQTSAPLTVAFPVVLGRSLKLSLSATSAQDRIGVLQETTALPFVGMLSCLAIFPAEKRLFLHEWKSPSRQSVTTFILSYTISESVCSIVSTFLLSLVFVYGMNLQHSASILCQFWFACWALISFGESLGIIFCALVDNGGLAVSLVSAGLTILSQLNGIISVTLPKWLKIVGWISPMKSQATIQIINEMKGLVFQCTPGDIESGACVAATGEQLLETFGIEPVSTSKYVAILAGLVVLFRLAAVGVMRLRMMVH